MFDDPIDDRFEELQDSLERMRKMVEALDEADSDIGPHDLEAMAAPNFDDSDLDRMEPEDMVDDHGTLIVTEEDYQAWQAGEKDREELGAHEADVITTPQRETGIITDLLTPRARAVLIDEWLRMGDEPVTLSLMAEQSDKLTVQSVHAHKDALLEYDIIIEDGKSGNATTYKLNYRNPYVQLLRMMQNISIMGRSTMLLERQFLAPGEDGEAIDEAMWSYTDE